VTPAVDSVRSGFSRGTAGVLGAALLFNLGQGVLRPTAPLYLQQVFAANYRMVTAIPTVFGAGKWIASLPTGYLLGLLGGRSLMVSGLLVIAVSDVASVMTSTYGVFLGLRALAGVGWAMFGTVATATMVDLPAARRRGRAVSLLMMSETSGLLLGTASGGWLYQGLGVGSPFLFEAACMFVAATLVARWALQPGTKQPATAGSGHRRPLREVLRTPGVFVMSVTNAVLTAIQTGVLAFLFPLYLVERGGFGPQAVGVLTSLGIVGRLVALWLGGDLSDRRGRPRVLVSGLLVYAALLGSVPLLTSSVGLGLWSLALGGAAGFVAPLPTAVVADQAPPPLQGLAIGWLRTVTDSGQILGPLVMGASADELGLAAPFQFGAVLLVAAAWRCRSTGRTMPAGVPTGGADDEGS
jgi:DHA1 family multidrug resistance protein-like MFS transporter